MLEIQLIRDNPGRVRSSLRDRGWPDTEIVEHVLETDAQRRNLLTRLQDMQAAANQASNTIGSLMREGKREQAQGHIADRARLKQKEKSVADQIPAVEQRLKALLLSIPNLTHESVPAGMSAADNHVIFTHGESPTFDFEPLPHWEIAANHGLIDFARGAKVAGAGFPFYIGQGARLQRALINFFLDLATTEGGYTEIQPPLMVNEDSARGTGQLPDKEGQMYLVGGDGLYPVPTAEVPLTNFYRDEVLNEADLPLRVCAYTPCWRREAGSYGKDVRGLNRLHQFDKVELVRITHPDKSYEALEALRSDAERVLQHLGLPYRRLLMCTGDMGFNQSKQYDLEVWSAGQHRWLEVSSVSNFTSYQARRMRIRFRPHGGGKPRLAHTLNGSALALPRIVAALLENNQRADGTVAIPEALAAYTGFDQIA